MPSSYPHWNLIPKIALLELECNKLTLTVHQYEKSYVYKSLSHLEWNLTSTLKTQQKILYNNEIFFTVSSYLLFSTGFMPTTARFILDIFFYSWGSTLLWVLTWFNLIFTSHDLPEVRSIYSSRETRVLVIIFLIFFCWSFSCFPNLS